MPTTASNLNPEASDRAAVAGRADAARLNARRWLQLALAALWLYDGLLQAQSFMFTRDFSTQMLDGAAAGNPGWLTSLIHANTRLIAAHPALWNLLFVLIQVALGLGIALRPTVKLALAVSVGWAVMVWVLGEGLGGLLTGDANALNGAPGAVILYAVAAMLVWPTGRDLTRDDGCVAFRAVGEHAAKSIWLVLWGGLALLSLQSANVRPDGLWNLISGMGDGQPSWVAATVRTVGDASRSHGYIWAAAEVLLLVLIAVGIVFRAPVVRVTVVAAVGAAAMIWLIGEALGAPFGGQSTDPNSGPLLALIAVAYWPVSRKPSAGVTWVRARMGASRRYLPLVLVGICLLYLATVSWGSNGDGGQGSMGSMDAAQMAVMSQSSSPAASATVDLVLALVMIAVVVGLLERISATARGPSLGTSHRSGRLVPAALRDTRAVGGVLAALALAAAYLLVMRFGG